MPGIANDSNDAAIIWTTIALAHELGILVVSEGVDAEQQSLFLAGQDYDVTQGYPYGRRQPGLRESKPMNQPPA